MQATISGDEASENVGGAACRGSEGSGSGLERVGRAEEGAERSYSGANGRQEGILAQGGEGDALLPLTSYASPSASPTSGSSCRGWGQGAYWAATIRYLGLMSRWQQDLYRSSPD